MGTELISMSDKKTKGYPSRVKQRHAISNLLHGIDVNHVKNLLPNDEVSTTTTSDTWSKRIWAQCTM